MTLQDVQAITNDLEALLAGYDLLRQTLQQLNPEGKSLTEVLREREAVVNNPRAVQRAMRVAEELRAQQRIPFPAEQQMARHWIEFALLKLARARAAAGPAGAS